LAVNIISFLASPKAFTGRAAIQQVTAVRSWLAVGAGIEVILYGDSPGTATVCGDLGLRHVPDIEATKGGVPYFGAIAKHAAEYARYDVQVYLNCDILLTPHILRAIESIKFPHFLLIGQRIDLSEGIEVNAADSELVNHLNALAQAGHISLHPPAGSDYFVFRRGMWIDPPPVVIGRAGYDNALIAYCLQRRIPVVDATLTVPALHQFHDYSHATGDIGEVFDGEDAKRNRAFIPIGAVPILEDADFLLTGGGLESNRSRGDWLWQSFLQCRYREIPILPSFLRLLWRIQLKLGLRNKWEPILTEVLTKISVNSQ
jgi:hypothetical protein